jgi:Uma2 family endonuclease
MMNSKTPMSVRSQSTLLTPEAYLEGELHSDVRHEYVAGHVYAMVGASRAHNRIAGNLYTALHGYLRGGPCQVFIADMKVRTAAAFYYPDVVVSCDPADQHEYYCERPLLIIEVLSPSTDRADTLEKRIAYQALTSLQEYVLVPQDNMEVRIYRRRGDSWELETYAAGDQVALHSVGLDLPIEQIFADAWR